MTKKPVIFQNYRSRQIIKAKSITEFCRKARLKSIDKFHFTAVLNGERLHHKGWHLPYNAEHIICDVYGNQYTVNNLVDFSKRHQLNGNRLKELIELDIPHYNGLYLLGQEPPPHKPKKVLRFCFSKKNKQIKKTKVSEIAEQIGTHRRSIYYVLNGERSKIKGWQLNHIEYLDKKGSIL